MATLSRTGRHRTGPRGCERHHVGVSQEQVEPDVECGALVKVGPAQPDGT